MHAEQVLAAYQKAWSLTSADEIRAALEGCCTDASVYRNPLTDTVHGISGLVNLILDFPVMFPGARMRTVGEPDIHHGAARFTWRLSSTAPIRTCGHDYGDSLEGVDFVEFDDTGRISRVTAFFGDHENGPAQARPVPRLTPPLGIDLRPTDAGHDRHQRAAG